MATPVSYVPLEPGILSSFGQGASFTTDSNPTLFTSSSFLYTFAFVIILVTASFRYAYAGTLRMQGTPKGITDSKEEFQRVTYGLLGVLGLWLILFTVNKDMLTGNVSLADLRVKEGTVTGSTAGQVGQGSSASYQMRVQSHNDVVNQLSSSNIHTNHNDIPCTESQFKETTPSCTSLAFLPQERISKLLSLHSSCNCSIVITGATEPGHAIGGYHGENKTGVDLQISPQKNDALYTFIKNNKTNSVSDTSNCYVTYLWGGMRFCDEKPRTNSTWAPHFHID